VSRLITVFMLTGREESQVNSSCSDAWDGWPHALSLAILVTSIYNPLFLKATVQAIHLGSRGVIP